MTARLPEWDAPESAYEKWLRENTVAPIWATPEPRPIKVIINGASRVVVMEDESCS